MALLLFFEPIPNAINSAIKGDFKEDDGSSYSDKVGKIIGGLSPVGDARDISGNKNQPKRCPRKTPITLSLKQNDWALSSISPDSPVSRFSRAKISHFR